MSSLTAMMMQHKLMYGDSLSPILAHFQKIPRRLQRSSVSSRVDLVEWRSSSPVLVAIEEGGDHRVHVGGGAYEEEDAKQEALEVEERRLLPVALLARRCAS